MRSPYDILELNSDASDEEVKKAYRRLSKKYHPDANIGNGKKDEFTEKFKQVQNAYKEIMEMRKKGTQFYHDTGYNFQNSQYQQIYTYIQMGHFQKAYEILNTIADFNRNAEWHCLYSLSLWGLRNPIAAIEYMKKACEMDPANQQYRQLLMQLQQGANTYHRMGSMYGYGNSCNPNQICCTILLANLCCGGSNFMCYPFCCC